MPVRLLGAETILLILLVMCNISFFGISFKSRVLMHSGMCLNLLKNWFLQKFTGKYMSNFILIKIIFFLNHTWYLESGGCILWYTIFFYLKWSTYNRQFPSSTHPDGEWQWMLENVISLHGRVRLNARFYSSKHRCFLSIRETLYSTGFYYKTDLCARSYKSIHEIKPTNRWSNQRPPNSQSINRSTHQGLER